MTTSERRLDHRLAPWLLLAMLAGMLVLVSISPRYLIYDEGTYLSNVRLVATHGIGREFLTTMQGMAGPLFPVVHHLLSPLTGDGAPGVRFVSVFFLLLTLAGVWVCARDRDPTAAVWVLAAPMVWVVSCLALTEMPALGCLLLGLASYLPVRGRDQGGAVTGLLRAGVGGILVSLAIVGRQPLLMVWPASAVLLLFRETDRLRWAIFVLLMLPLPLWAFATWGGLLSPDDGNATVSREGFLLTHPVLTLGFVGIVALAFVPGWFRLRVRSCLLVLLLTVGANLIFGWVARTPLESQLEVWLPEMLLFGSQRVFGGLLLGMGVLFGLSALVNAWERRDDGEFLFLTLILLLTAGANGRNTHQFSSRYAVYAIPLLAILATRFVPRNPRWRIVGTAVGGMAGTAAVVGYFLVYAR